MKTVRLSFVLCSLSCLLVCLFGGTARAASASWAVVNTAAYGKDASPSTETALSSYSAYLCSAETAVLLFGGDGSVASVTSYLKANYSAGLSSLATSATALKTGDYDLGQYTFANYNLSASPVGDYLAIVAYDDGDEKAVRVFANGASGGRVVFDDQPGYTSGTFGAWTPAAVPEPTSGLLILLGLAALSLRRIDPLLRRSRK